MNDIQLALTTAAWGVASAIAVVGLGTFSLVGGKSRPRGGLAFGAFAVFWGLQLATYHLAAVIPSAAIASTLYLLGFACMLPLPYFLVEFGLSQSPRRPRRSLLPGVARAATLGPAAVAVLLLLITPSALFGGVAPVGQRFVPIWTPLYMLLGPILVMAAVLFAVVELARAMRSAPTPRTADRSASLLAGLGLYAAFSVANNFAYYVVAELLYELTAVDHLLIVAFSIGFTIVLALLRSLYRDIGRERKAEDRMRVKLVLLSLLVPMLFGTIEGALAAVLVLPLETVGLWRLAGVGVIAYGLARWRLYDLPQRTRKAAANAGGATLAAAGGAAAYGAGTLLAASAAVPVLAGLAVFGAALFPSLSFVRRFATKAVSEAEHDQQMYGQRIDTYRAALESSIARGTLEEDAEFLGALRERFGITEAEERVVLYYAKSSVVVARDTDAWGAYERLRLLGEGGAGRTWLSRDRARDRLVVLKEPIEHWQRDPNLRAHVLREARIAAKVRHPNVVAVEEVVEHQGAPIIVMEYLEGGSLADLLRRRGTLPWQEAARLTIGVLRGLEAVHAAGIVHRDIKPSNILLAADGSPKVGDFGIALSPPAAGGGAASARTMIDVNAPAIAGTPSYMAPEAREGSGDRRVDVYGGAAVLHECVFGSPPVPDAPVVQRNDLSPVFLAVLARGLAARPEDRYPSARAFADDLSRLVSSP